MIQINIFVFLLIHRIHVRQNKTALAYINIHTLNKEISSNKRDWTIYFIISQVLLVEITCGVLNVYRKQPNQFTIQTKIN